MTEPTPTNLREPLTGVTPHLTCDGAAKAIDFYVKAFGAREMERVAAPDGKLMHGHVVINGASVFLNDCWAEHGALDPNGRGGSSVCMHLRMGSPAEVDAACQRAVDAGCTVQMEVQDMFWGDRYGSVIDPWGHVWAFGALQQG